MLINYRQTAKQMSVDICIYGIMNFIYGNIELTKIGDKQKAAERRIEKFNDILDGKSSFRMKISKKYRNYIHRVEDRIEYWEEVFDSYSIEGQDIIEQNIDIIRGLPIISEIQAEIKRKPDLSPIFYGNEY